MSKDKKEVYANIQFKKLTNVVRYADPDDEWDADSTVSDWILPEFFRGTKDNNYHSEPLSFTPVKGETYYMVYAIWSTGDSFSHHERGECESFGIYKTRKEAEKRKANLEAPRTEKSYRQWEYRPWDGYFESLDELGIKEITFLG